MRLFISTSIATVLLASAIPFVCGFDRIIAFADSYTDNGNDYRHSGDPPSPPYWKGRFSNGPTWLEQVAKELKGVTVLNHGHGGATADNDYAYSKFNGYVVPGLKQQIELYGVDNSKPDDDLYIIEIGANSLNALLTPEAYTTFYARTIIKPEDKQRATQMVKQYNDSLMQKVKNIQGAAVSILDFNGWVSDALAHPERLGLRTDNGPCIPGINEKVTPCDDPEKHFFWDFYHPEAKVHKALGEWATEKLKEKYHFD